MVDVSDLGILAAHYGLSIGATWSMGDFNGDGAVDVADLGVLAANYGDGIGGCTAGPMKSTDDNDHGLAAVVSDCPGIGFLLMAVLLLCTVLNLNEFFMKGAM